MSLRSGERLSGGAGSHYEVVGGGWCTARHEFVRARKLYRNFRYPADDLEEAPLEEGLLVLARQPLGAQREESLRFELERVLADRSAPWFAQPLDVVDSVAGDRLLILADPAADRIGRGPPADPGSGAALARLFSEVPLMLHALRRQGLAAWAFDTDDFVLDASGRWTFLGTDRIRPLGELPTPFADFEALKACASLALLGHTDRESHPAADAATFSWLFEELGRARQVEVAEVPTRAEASAGSAPWLRRLFARVRPRDLPGSGGT